MIYPNFGLSLRSNLNKLKMMSSSQISMNGIQAKLLTNEGRLFLALAALGHARSSQWRDAAGLSNSSFYQAKANLLINNYVIFYIKDEGNKIPSTYYEVNKHAWDQFVKIFTPPPKKWLGL